MAGSGLLVGTALSVIIPEGVSALYSAQHHEGKGTVPSALKGIFMTTLWSEWETGFGQVGDY